MQAGKKTAFLPVTRPTHMMNKQFCKAFFLPFENSSRWKVAFMKNAKVDKHNQNKECFHNSH